MSFTGRKTLALNTPCTISTQSSPSSIHRGLRDLFSTQTHIYAHIHGKPQTDASLETLQARSLYAINFLKDHQMTREDFAKTYTWAQTRNSEEGHDCDNDNDIGSHLRHSVVPANASEVVVVFGETSRTFFSKSLSSSPSSSSSENDQEALETAVELLSTLLLLSTHFLLLLVVFGPPYLLLATALVLPPRYQQTSAPRILRTFRFYLPAMAYNEPHAGRRLRRAHRHGARVFGAGDAALVWANNTASMAVRALYAWRFARRFCKARAVPHRQRETERALGLAALRPPLGVLVAFAAAAVCMRWSAAAHAGVRLSLWAQRWHIALGGACLGLRLGATPGPEDDRSFEEEPEVTRK
ncbi:hypothetical protein EDB85DRAFT_2285657 [Lactarius pseudohatsudake]|nr:hypothetical protein EDB85DRAFT_2285657 [Lactarius pseudohatsudake]